MLDMLVTTVIPELGTWGQEDSEFAFQACLSYIARAVPKNKKEPPKKAAL